MNGNVTLDPNGHNLHDIDSIIVSLAVWYESIIEVDGKGVVLYDSPLPRYILERFGASQHNVVFRRARMFLNRSQNDRRFLIYNHVISYETLITHAVLTDLFDVRWKRAPAAIFQHRSSNSVLVGFDRYDWHKAWNYLTAIWKFTCRANLTMEMWEKQERGRPEQLYNAGIIGAARDTLLVILSRMTSLFQLTNTNANCNMMVFNIVMSQLVRERLIVVERLNQTNYLEQIEPKADQAVLLHKGRGWREQLYRIRGKLSSSPLNSTFFGANGCSRGDGGGYEGENTGGGGGNSMKSSLSSGNTNDDDQGSMIGSFVSGGSSDGDDHNRWQSLASILADDSVPHVNYTDSCDFLHAWNSSLSVKAEEEGIIAVVTFASSKLSSVDATQRGCAAGVFKEIMMRKVNCALRLPGCSMSYFLSMSRVALIVYIGHAVRQGKEAVIARLEKHYRDSEFYRLAAASGSDKAAGKPTNPRAATHFYHVLYARHSPLFQSMLEIGLGCLTGQGPGHSYALWRNFTSSKLVHFIEYNRACVMEAAEGGAEWAKSTSVADQSNVHDLFRAAREYARVNHGSLEVDAIVDDGGHHNKYILLSYAVFSSALRWKRYYIEDFGESYRYYDWRNFLEATAVDFVAELPDAIGVTIDGIECAPNHCVMIRDS